MLTFLQLCMHYLEIGWGRVKEADQWETGKELTYEHLSAETHRAGGFMNVLSVNPCRCYEVIGVIPTVLLLFSQSVGSDSSWPHGLQHARLPRPSLSPRVCLNSSPLSGWCHSIPFYQWEEFACTLLTGEWWGLNYNHVLPGLELGGNLLIYNLLRRRTEIKCAL